MKTLKDIEKDYDEELVVFVDGSGELPPFLSIKCGKCGNTNQFEWEGDEDFIKWYHRKMKEVAREWIDKMNNGYCYCHEENHMNEWKDYNECVMGNNIVISWIRNFFNLEDEE